MGEASHGGHRRARFQPEVAANSGCQLPDTDVGLPGAGPIQRGDWFRKLWFERRHVWAQRVEQDKGAVVFLGDSITQGWGDDMGKNFPELKVANRGIGGDTTRGVLIRLKQDVISLQPSAVCSRAFAADCCQVP